MGQTDGVRWLLICAVSTWIDAVDVCVTLIHEFIWALFSEKETIYLKPSKTQDYQV